MAAWHCHCTRLYHRRRAPLSLCLLLVLCWLCLQCAMLIGGCSYTPASSVGTRISACPAGRERQPERLGRRLGAPGVGASAPACLPACPRPGCLNASGASLSLSPCLFAGGQFGFAPNFHAICDKVFHFPFERKEREREREREPFRLSFSCSIVEMFHLQKASPEPEPRSVPVTTVLFGLAFCISSLVVYYCHNCVPYVYIDHLALIRFKQVVCCRQLA